jgi:hypothetical protein
MGRLGSGALVGRGPVPPGLKDIGIREGTFTLLFGVEVAEVGCGAIEVERGGPDEVGDGTVACVVVVGGADGPGAVDNADVTCWVCEGLVEGSWFWALGVPGDDLRRAASAAAS